MSNSPQGSADGGGRRAAPARRSFVAGAGALAAGGLALLAPLVSAVRAALDPMRRKGPEQGMVRVAMLAAIPADGVPRRFRVVSDRTDAWNTQREVPVGAVYLRRTGDSIEALNVVCPHAGCFVNLAADRSRFVCPCHRSSFDLSGAVDDPASPSPRAMDALEVEVRDGEEVWVRFRNFLPGRADKVAV